MISVSLGTLASGMSAPFAPLFDKKKWVTCGLNRCASPHIKSSYSLTCNDCYYRGYDGPQLTDQREFFFGGVVL